MIRIVNKKNYEGPGEYVGRPSPLGNPFPVQMGREFCILRFREWIREQPEDSDQWKELRRLAEIYRRQGFLTLICWCAPLACHADVIAEIIMEIVGDVEREPERELPSSPEP